MVDIHLYPAKIGDAADSLRADVDQWGNQLRNYRRARGAAQAAITRGFVRGADNNWFGGPGKAGDVQSASREFLRDFLEELDRLVREKQEFTTSFEAYLNALAGLANGVQSADNAASDTMNNILKDLKGGH